MLKRNELLMGLQTALARKIQIPNIVIDDIFTYDVRKGPFLVIKTTDTEIQTTNADTWKHTMAVEFEILAPNKETADHLLEELLAELEVFAAQKQPKGIKVEKLEVSSTPLYALALEMDFVFFTPSFRG